jgi:hypothetical protein
MIRKIIKALWILLAIAVVAVVIIFDLLIVYQFFIYLFSGSNSQALP